MCPRRGVLIRKTKKKRRRGKPIRFYCFRVCNDVWVFIDFVDGLAQESDPDGNHLLIWPFFFFFFVVSAVLTHLAFTCLSCARGPRRAFKSAGAGNSPPHRRDISRKMNLHCDRGDSQLTESVRAPDADGRTFSEGVPHDQEKKTKKQKGKTEREERQSGGLLDVTRLRWRSLGLVHVAPQVDPDGAGVTAPPLTSHC